MFDVIRVSALNVGEFLGVFYFQGAFLLIGYLRHGQGIFLGDFTVDFTY